jgi:2-amino-4-hydroxy-6-hydroxymethyldihydropteridine diphosphokinase
VEANPQAGQLAYVALGSNQGDSLSLVRTALDRLEAFSSQPLLRSSLWRTSPVDCPPGSPAFVNAVAGLWPLPEETPETLLEKLLRLEAEFGPRARLAVNAPRFLDLDLIAFRQEMRQSLRLVLPHPRAHLRRFVLLPLSEIAPTLLLPGQGRNVADLLASVRSAEQPAKL